jgi:hypothetical protein
VDDEDFAEDFAADEVEAAVSEAPVGAFQADDAECDIEVDDAVSDIETGDAVSDFEGAGATGWQLPEQTGVQAVDESLEPILELDHLPTSEHVAYYEAAHRRLQDALADLDGS